MRLVVLVVMWLFVLGLAVPVGRAQGPADSVRAALSAPAQADTVRAPVDTVRVPVDTVRVPVDTVRVPVDTVRVPVDTVRVQEDVAESFDDIDPASGDPAQLAEILTDLADNPLDVNAATADELALIPAVSPLLAERIVRFRDANGPFASIPEIRRVEGVSDRVFVEARPYLRIGAPVEAAARPSPYPRAPSLGWVRQNLEAQVLQRVERRLDVGRGYDDDTTRTTFEGDPTRLTTRIRVNARRRVRMQLTLDKDPGEPFRWAPQSGSYGYDHVAGSVGLQDFGRVRSLVVGDFTAEFGQGMTLWRGVSFGKGRDPVDPLLRSGRGVVPFGSTEENRFFRGAAATVRLTPTLSVTGFASRRTLDATLGDVDTTAGDPVGLAPASTLSESGLHRTPSEIDGKDALREDAAGGAVEWVRGRTRLGVAAVHSRFDRRLDAGDAPYQRFDFDGRRATTASVYGNAFVGDAVLFGEVAQATGGAVGGVAGAALDLGARAEAVVVGRVYPRDFVSLHGNAFGERNGATQNETGVYTGVRMHVARKWRVSTYVDTYRFPWVRFAVPRPTSGIDGRLVVEHTPRPWLSHYVQVRSETREAGATASDAGGRRLDAVQPETRQSLRWHGTYAFNDAVTLRTRVEATRFEDLDAPARTGFLLYQDVRWAPVETLQLDARLAFFDTDGFDARVFAYEYDLLYAFSVPAFFGRGQRAYVLARYRPTPSLTLEAKYGVTRFEDVDTVGSGLNEVDGNRVRGVGVQVRWTVGR